MNTLLETALQLPISPVRNVLLQKLTNNQQTFLFNTNIVSYTIIFWPAVFRLLTIYLRANYQEMVDHAKDIVKKVFETASPFWKEAIIVLFHAHGINI